MKISEGNRRYLEDNLEDNLELVIEQIGNQKRSLQNLACDMVREIKDCDTVEHFTNKFAAIIDRQISTQRHLMNLIEVINQGKR